MIGPADDTNMPPSLPALGSGLWALGGSWQERPRAQSPEPRAGGGWISFLLKLLEEPRLTAWRNDSLDPHVGDEVAVVFDRVDGVRGQHHQFRFVAAHEL